MTTSQMSRVWAEVKSTVLLVFIAPFLLLHSAVNCEDVCLWPFMKTQRLWTACVCWVYMQKKHKRDKNQQYAKQLKCLENISHVRQCYIIKNNWEDFVLHFVAAVNLLFCFPAEIRWGSSNETIMDSIVETGRALIRWFAHQNGVWMSKIG